VRVAIAHEWLVRYGGSERCVEELLRAFPDARLITTLYEPDAMPASFRGAEPSFLQRVPGSTGHHEWLVPLMPAAWRLRRPVSDVAAVLSSSHACAKAVRVADGVAHVCYCHSPMRYAWDFGAEASRFPRSIRPLARRSMAAFRRWDRGTAARVTHFVANSSAVRRRIERYYGRTAEVVFPPVRTDYFTPNGTERADEFLFAGRLVAYKRPDLVVRAFAELPYRLVVVGTGHLEAELRAAATPNVEFRPHVDDEELRTLYRRARALVYPAEEDFGIAMAEAQATGTPVIALGRGGARDIVVDGVTGRLLDEQTVPALRDAVVAAAREELDGAAIRANAERFSGRRFRDEMRTVVAELVGTA
jgi:glycosyltransferase involved in cell wall biosynthesis